MNKFILLDGYRLALQKNEFLKCMLTDVSLSLVTILVGYDEASKIYVESKIKACNDVGIITKPYYFTDDITEQDLLKHIEKLNNDSDIHGILVQLPLPKHIDTYKILEAIDITKDVDCFHPYHVGNLSVGASDFAPATPTGVMMLLDSIKDQWSLESKNVVVIGASNIVGKPMAMLLSQHNATVTLVHKKTRNLCEFTEKADLIVSATGQVNLITADMVSDGVVLIDVGMNRIKTKKGTKLVGDIDFEGVKEKCFAVTPVPKGVGPMTICALLYNLWYLYNKYHKNKN